MLETARNAMPIHSAWLAACVNEVKSEDAIVVSELGVPIAHLDLTKHGSYMGNMLAGGLGMGLGAALGAKLAAPEREVIVAVGDGSYMFGNPLPYHFVGRAENLPTLTIIANNHSWHAVRAVDPRRLSRRQRRQGQRDAADPARARAGLREGGRDLRRLRREGRGARATCWRRCERGIDAVRSGTPALINVSTQGRHN